MSFTVEDFHHLRALLEQHPEWRAELRRMVLSEELLQLPDLVRELVMAQKRTDERVDRLAEQLVQLTRRLDELAQRVDQLTQRMDALVTWANRVTDDLGKLKRWSLEHLYASRALTFFGKMVKRAHALTAEELDAMLDDAMEAGKITQEERNDLLLTDLGCADAGTKMASPYIW